MVWTVSFGDFWFARSTNRISYYGRYSCYTKPNLTFNKAGLYSSLCWHKHNFGNGALAIMANDGVTGEARKFQIHLDESDYWTANQFFTSPYSECRLHVCMVITG